MDRVDWEEADEVGGERSTMMSLNAIFVSAMRLSSSAGVRSASLAASKALMAS